MNYSYLCLLLPPSLPLGQPVMCVGEEMGCTSAKQVLAVPSGEEGRSKAYSNGDLLSGQYWEHIHLEACMGPILQG